MKEKRVYQRLRIFDTLIDTYDWSQPFSRFLSSFFRRHRQMGSNDRRIASRLCYNYFRLGNTLTEFSRHQRLAIAEFLCEGESEFTTTLLPNLNNYSSLSLSDRIDYCEEHFRFELGSLFPLGNYLSGEIDKNSFFKSHFIQPRLFIRIYPGWEQKVLHILKQNEIIFEKINKNTLSFDNGTKLSQIVALKGKYQVQDLSSQRTVTFFQPSAHETWWDACAGSGGKSIPLMQEEPSVHLLASDSRQNILKNLELRFAEARISNYRKKVIDLSEGGLITSRDLFDGIVVDVPCSGSGTWGRTPEMLNYFSRDQLDRYSNLQKQIVSNVIIHLKLGKPLVYITCSVYRNENEDICQYLVEKGMTIEKKAYLKGYDNNADTLFVARLIK